MRIFVQNLKAINVLYFAGLFTVVRLTHRMCIFSATLPAN